MWPIPALSNEFVSFLFSPTDFVCTWIQKNNNGTAPLIIRAYQRYPLHNLELEHCVLFNPTTIKQYMTAFIAHHGIANAFMLYSLDGDKIQQEFVPLATSTPSRAEIGMHHSSNLIYDYRYLYPDDNGQFIFYRYVVPRSLLLPYQLLAIATHSNLITITTKNMALLTTYKNIFGAAFRRSQLFVDMMRTNNSLDDLISIDALKRMILIPSSLDLHEERSFLATACGLFLLERNL